ncbi:MAG: T9SS type A sorting domain-containing protein [Bacteroidetes bacterium]|nr:T9SS type A sorting domain-containing protein [Bacteroidota bacterium]
MFFLKKYTIKQATKQVIYICLVLLAFSRGKAQTFTNIVPNGSFETYTQCPTYQGQISNAVPWTGPLINSTDYFNACSSQCNVPYWAGVSYTAYPFFLNSLNNGTAYVGYWHFQSVGEYLQVKLSDTLKNGVCYYAEFYTVVGQCSLYYTNNVGASFSAVEYPTNYSSNPSSTLNIPQHITRFGNPIVKDTLIWNKIAGLYTGSGIEAYILIGNTKSNSNTDTLNVYPHGSYQYLGAPNSYRFIDAVSVFSINPSGLLPWSYNDTTVTLGDSVYIGNYMGGNFSPKWYTMAGNYIANNAGIFVSPTVTTQYVVQYTVCGTPRGDTVKVTVVPPSGLNESNGLNNSIFMFPNPAEDKLNIEFKNIHSGVFKITLASALGSSLLQKTVKVDANNKTTTLNLNLANGVYLVSITNINTNETSCKKLLIAR